MKDAPSLVRLLERWREQRTDPPGAGGAIDVVDVELIRPGRPGLIDVVAEMDGRLAHAVFAIRRPGDELHVLGAVEEPTLGTIDDDDGVGLVVDALHDVDAARLLLDAVAGTTGTADTPATSRDAAVTEPPVVSVVRDDGEATSLVFDRRVTLTVFPWLSRTSHPGTTLLAGLDEAGFNHLPAPVAFWRRAGRDLGIVQEILAGASSGWALAISSLRDLVASGLSPDMAGGDFAPEAFALGTMAARMHMALDRAFGRQPGDVAAWVDALAPDALAGSADGRGGSGRGALGTSEGGADTDTVETAGASTEQLLDTLRTCGLHPPTIRTHGDFHLGRTARTDHGWVLADAMPGGIVPGAEEPVFRSPLADMADFTWSLHRAAAVAANERGPASATTRAGDLAAAWEVRNRQAFVAAYLATPGIGALVPADRRVVRRLLRLFELARTARGRWGIPSLR